MPSPSIREIVRAVLSQRYGTFGRILCDKAPALVDQLSAEAPGLSADRLIDRIEARFRPLEDALLAAAVAHTVGET